MLHSESVGEIGVQGKVLVIRKITVVYHLRTSSANAEIAQRVLGFHADFCPVARTIAGCVDIETQLRLELEEDSSAERTGSE